MTRRNTDPAPGTVRLVRERDDWRCARCAGWGPLSTQHRVGRGMGGSRWAGINLPGNPVTLCGSGTTLCHGWEERHPTYAEDHGWSVRRSSVDRRPPAEVPVWTWQGWVLLDDEGGLERLEDHPGVTGCGCGCQGIPEPDALLWGA